MRTYIRKKVALTDDLDISTLSGLNKIVTAIRYKYSKSRLYARMQEKTENQLLQERMERVEKLKNVLLYDFNKELLEASSTVELVRFTVDRNFKDIIEETINSVDFLSYNIRIVPENKDYLEAFPNLPILLEVRRKA